MSVITNPAAGAEGSAQSYIDATLELLGGPESLGKVAWEPKTTHIRHEILQLVPTGSTSPPEGTRRVPATEDIGNG